MLIRLHWILHLNDCTLEFWKHCSSDFHYLILSKRILISVWFSYLCRWPVSLSLLVSSPPQPPHPPEDFEICIHRVLLLYQYVIKYLFFFIINVLLQVPPPTLSESLNLSQGKFSSISTITFSPTSLCFILLLGSCWSF